MAPDPEDQDFALTEELSHELRMASDSAKRGESFDMESVLAEVERACGVSVDEATEQELAQVMAEADTEEGVSVEEAFARLPPRPRTP